ncbi:YhdH/YhfP family quinone oxidoreductase [Aliarcobacter vitoriensis]|uniref:Oxidoreductase n=1 Tax=Aliarcobacter vitoriensis TaxID=2011099 RepID=A0A366MSE1_9BACT|nr:YhdH/YhfP family quinone oxidoreductase [Aliarcobacter vitoriensis]RBQ28773.1 oxidoreductase [Aliarcobacter vitoriensis]
MKAFVVEKNKNDEIISSVKDVQKPICNENEILIKVEYSSLNYKDALSSIGHSGVTRNFPHITGVDVSGTVYETKSPIFKIGQNVVVTGYDLGMNSDGGHCEFVKVPASWAIPTPDSISNKDIMIYGTAGLTSALSINELINNGLQEHSSVLVTGSTGGVGSISVAILNKLGFKVTALTTKKDKDNFLKSLGATEVILIDDFMQNKQKPMLKENFDAVIDSVGGEILAQAIKQVKYDGIVTCCGLTASYELNTNVFPFILRGIRLIGIDSVECKIEKKQKAWEKLAGKWKIECLDAITKEISLEEIKEAYEKLLSGKATGRYLIKI